MSEAQDFSQDNNALQVIARAEIDMQVATAKRWPRKTDDEIKGKLLDAFHGDIKRAESAFYWLPPRRKKDGTLSEPITGPSVRLAEMYVQHAGNIQSQTRILEVNRADRYVVTQALVWDLENNSRHIEEAQRRITFGGDDGIQLAVTGATSVAYRNAVCRVAGSLIREIAEAAMTAVAHDLKPKKEKMFEAFEKDFGVSPAQLLKLCDPPVASLADITGQHLAQFRGLYQALKQGDTTVDSIFDQPRSGRNQAAETGKLRPEDLQAVDEDPAPQQEPEPEPEPEPQEGPGLEPEPEPEPEPSPKAKPNPKTEIMKIQSRILQMLGQHGVDSAAFDDLIDKAVKQKSFPANDNNTKDWSVDTWAAFEKWLQKRFDAKSAE